MSTMLYISSDWVHDVQFQCLHTIFVIFVTSRAKKWPKNCPKLLLGPSVVRNGWNSVEQSWNGFTHVQADNLGPIWVRWVPPNLAQGQGGPKMAA